MNLRREHFAKTALVDFGLYAAPLELTERAFAELADCGIVALKIFTTPSPPGREREFAGLCAQGIALWIGFQAFINIGVNLGALPTKGLTLPLMSYGGSAILINLVALAIVARVDFENRQKMRGGRS